MTIIYKAVKATVVAEFLSRGRRGKKRTKFQCRAVLSFLKSLFKQKDQKFVLVPQF